MSSKGYRIRGVATDTKEPRNSPGIERIVTEIPQSAMAKILDRNRNNDPLVDYKLQYNELKEEMQELYKDFKSFIVNEVFNPLKNLSHKNIGSSLRALLFEQNETEPIVIARFMKHAIKTVLKLQSETAQDLSKVTYTTAVQKADSNKRKEDTDYEILLMKAEQEIKQHIRVEKQLKLVIEMFQTKFQEAEKSKVSVTSSTKSVLQDIKGDNLKLVDIIKAKDYEILNLSKLVKHKEEHLESLDQQLLGMQVLEVKLQNLRTKHNKEKEEMKKFYESEFVNITKEVQRIHRTLSMNIVNDDKIKLMHKELMSYKDFNIRKIQAIETKLKLFNDIADLAESPTHINYHYSDLVPKDFNADDEPISLSNSPKARDGVIEEFPNSHRSSQAEGEGKAIRSYRAHNDHVKKLFEKQKKGLLQEINVLSLKRTGDLQGQVKDMLNGNPHSIKHFDNYYHQLSNKLDSLNMLNLKEKAELKSLDDKLEVRKSSELMIDSARSKRSSREGTSRFATQQNTEKQTEVAREHIARIKSAHNFSRGGPTAVTLGSAKRNSEAYQ